MLSCILLVGILCLIRPPVLAIPTDWGRRVEPRQAAAAQASRVYGGSGWIEIMAARASGQLLLPHTNVPELWGFTPETKVAVKLLSFPGALGLTGIAEISPDVFAVAAGNFSTRDMTVKSGSWTIWKVDLTGGTPKATRIKSVPDSGFFLGIAAIDNSTILIADARKGSLYKMDMMSGDYSVVLADKSMDRNGQLAGIHGLHYIDGHAYYTNTFGGGLWKLQVDSSGKAMGSPTQVTPLSRPEDFVRGPGGVFYVGRMAGMITKLTPDGKTSQYVGASGSTSLVLGRGDKDRNVLYISTTSGSVLSTTLL